VKAAPNYSLADQVQQWALHPGNFLPGAPSFELFARVVRREPAISGLADRIADYGVRLRAVMRNAEWMVLDDDAVANLVRWGWPPTWPLIKHSIELARAPFRATWIEWDVATFLRVQSEIYGQSGAQTTKSAAMAAQAEQFEGRLDRVRVRTGVLIERRAADDSAVWRMRLFGNADGDGVVSVSPLVAWVSSDAPLASVLQGVQLLDAPGEGYPPLLPLISLFGDSPDRPQVNPEAMAWGKKHARYPALGHVGYVLEEYSGALVMLRHAEAADIYGAGMKEMAEILDSQAGTLRFALLALALIDLAATEYVHRARPAGRRIIHGHLVPGHDHRIVSIKIDLKPQRVTRYLQRAAATRSGVKAHRVRGHWQRYGGVRRWKETYRRGDESLGWVDHDYVVEPEHGG
jgi:hypothetical protein